MMEKFPDSCYDTSTVYIVMYVLLFAWCIVDQSRAQMTSRGFRMT